MPDPDIERNRPRDSARAAGPAGSGAGSGTPRSTGGITLTSPAFSDHDLIPERYTKQGANVSPPLEWSGAPDGTEELVLICEDPDAPSGMFVHWALFHIDPGTTSIGEGETPSGAIAARNGFGESGWGGPLPPVGDEPHRYFFRLYALGEPLDLARDVAGDEVRAAVAGMALASGTVVGRFGR